MEEDGCLETCMCVLGGGRNPRKALHDNRLLSGLSHSDSVRMSDKESVKKGFRAKRTEVEMERESERE